MKNGNGMHNRNSFVNFHIRHFTGTSLFCDVRPYVDKVNKTVTVDRYTFHLKDVKSVRLNRNSKTAYVSLVEYGEFDGLSVSGDFTTNTMNEFFGDC